MSLEVVGQGLARIVQADKPLVRGRFGDEFGRVGVRRKRLRQGRAGFRRRATIIGDLGVSPRQLAL